jgi:hypothetical protein
VTKLLFMIFVDGIFIHSIFIHSILVFDDVASKIVFHTTLGLTVDT